MSRRQCEAKALRELTQNNLGHVIKNSSSESFENELFGTTIKIIVMA